MKVKDVIRILKANGFELNRTRGSHRQFKGVIEDRKRLVTVSGKENQDMKIGILKSVIRQSGLPKKTFLQERDGK